MDNLRDIVVNADEARQWISVHEYHLNIATLWAALISVLAMGVVDVATWWMLRPTRDRTSLGFFLKYKKLFSGIAWLSIAALFVLALWAAYNTVRYDLLVRYTARSVMTVSLVIAAVFGVMFMSSFIRERRRIAERDIPDIIVADGGQ